MSAIGALIANLLVSLGVPWWAAELVIVSAITAIITVAVSRAIRRRRANRTRVSFDINPSFNEYLSTARGAKVFSDAIKRNVKQQMDYAKGGLIPPETYANRLVGEEPCQSFGKRYRTTSEGVRQFSYDGTTWANTKL